MIAETTGETIEYAEKEGEVNPFEDIENALTLLRERATTVEEGIRTTIHPNPAIFETQESGETVEYIFDAGDLYRVVA